MCCGWVSWRGFLLIILPSVPDNQSAITHFDTALNSRPWIINRQYGEYVLYTVYSRVQNGLVRGEQRRNTIAGGIWNFEQVDRYTRPIHTSLICCTNIGKKSENICAFIWFLCHLQEIITLSLSFRGYSHTTFENADKKKRDKIQVVSGPFTSQQLYAIFTSVPSANSIVG